MYNRHDCVYICVNAFANVRAHVNYMCICVRVFACECVACVPPGEHGQSVRPTVKWCYIVAFEWFTVVLQWCYSGVAVVLQWCYSGVAVVLQSQYSLLTVV
jgi:hypothetical protein